MKKARDLVGALCLVLALAGMVAAAEATPVIVVLHTNDVHGRFAAGEDSIGHDTIAGIYRETRRRVPATILLDAGDAIQGTPLVKWNQGEAAIDIMNRVGYDGMTLGNHEFDYGWEKLPELAETAAFPFFTQPVVSEGRKGFEAAAIYERGGRRIGVFGLTTPHTKQSSVGGLTREFGADDDLMAYAEAMVYSLKNAGAEVVVCLTHLGTARLGSLTSYSLRDRVDGIDLIVDGHSHTPLAEIEQAEGGALIVSTGALSRFLGVVEFFCENGRLRPRARSIAREEAALVAPVPEVTEAVAAWVKRTEARGARVVAWTPVALDADRDKVRTRETEIGNLLTDSIRAATGADVAFMNGGGIRASLPAGDLTASDVESMLPFDTVVFTAALPGGAIREALEISVAHYPESPGAFLQVSGLAFVFDPALPSGKRVTRVDVGGTALDDDRMYMVSAIDWLAMGGDGYGLFVKPFAESSDRNAAALMEMFVDYLNRNKDKRPVVEGRITVAE